MGDFESALKVIYVFAFLGIIAFLAGVLLGVIRLFTWIF